MLADGEMTREQFKRANERTRAQLEVITTEMADAVTLDALGPFLKAAAAAESVDGRRDLVTAQWDRCDLDVRRAVITTLFSDIVLHPPGRGKRVFDPNTVSTTWTSD